MKKMKEKMKDKMKEKEEKKKGGCVPEIIAVKKTKIIPVAVPVRSAQPKDDYSPPAPSYSPPPQPAPVSNTYSSPPSAVMSAPNAGGYTMGTSGDSGYGADTEDEDEGGYGDDEHDDDDEEGYDEHEESYGVEGHAAEGYESDADEHGDDDEYRRRSGNESQLLADPTSTTPVIEYTSLVSEEGSRNSKPHDYPLEDRHSERRRSKRDPESGVWKERRLIPRFRRSLSHPGSRWRVSGSLFFMQQGFW